MRASTPGKVMLAGEYAVLTGHRAIVAAINRRVSAEIGQQKMRRSPFLQAVHDEIAARFAADSNQAHTAERVVVNSDALRQAGEKLGLGSSAAVTVAAVTLALGNKLDSHDEIHAIAHAAHVRAQATLGAAGSGADIAACCFGGIVDVCKKPQEGAGAPLAVTRLVWPERMRLVLVWTQTPASTPKLVAAVNAFAQKSRAEHQACMDALGDVADMLARALGTADPTAVIAAFKQGAEALAGLQSATKLPLVPEPLAKLATLAQRFGGAAKPTGAGGGDLLAAVFADADAADRFCAAATERGIVCLEAGVDPSGTVLVPLDSA